VGITGGQRGNDGKAMMCGDADDMQWLSGPLMRVMPSSTSGGLLKVPDPLLQVY
jgi:hypothetical protein